MSAGRERNWLPTRLSRFGACAANDRLYLGRYWVSAASGSTGYPGLFICEVVDGNYCPVPPGASGKAPLIKAFWPAAAGSSSQ